MCVLFKWTTLGLPAWKNWMLTYDRVNRVAIVFFLFGKKSIMNLRVVRELPFSRGSSPGSVPQARRGFPWISILWRRRDYLYKFTVDVRIHCVFRYFHCIRFFPSQISIDFPNCWWTTLTIDHNKSIIRGFLHIYNFWSVSLSVWCNFFSSTIP